MQRLCRLSVRRCLSGHRQEPHEREIGIYTYELRREQEGSIALSIGTNVKCLVTHDEVTARPALKIANVVHKGLRRLIEDDDASGLQPAIVPKLRRIVSFLQDMERENEIRMVPSWKAHLLTGDRKGVWSLFVTKNWRLTFRIDNERIEIVDLDYEDYH